MNALWLSWVAMFVAIVGIVVAAGWAARRRVFGALVDSRGRYSLSRLQLGLWGSAVLSMAGAVFVARLVTREADAAATTIPPTVLWLLALSAGSAVLAGAIKAYKNSARPAWVAASPDGAASLAQLVLVEEGPEADRLVDVAKLQQLVVTVLLVVAYVALGVQRFGDGVASMPPFAGALLALLAISHGTYLVAKVPNHGTSDAERPSYSVLDRLVNTADRRRQELHVDHVAGDRRAARRLRRQRWVTDLIEKAQRAEGQPSSLGASTQAATQAAAVLHAAAVPAPSPGIESYVGRAQVVQDPDEDEPVEPSPLATRTRPRTDDPPGDGRPGNSRTSRL